MKICIQGFFQNFGDDENQNKLRSDLLKSMAKDGEFAMSHRKTKTQRIATFGDEKKGIEEMAEYRRNYNAYWYRQML